MRYVMFVLDMSFNIVDMVWVDCQNMTTHPHHVDNVNGHTEDNTLQVVCAPQLGLSVLFSSQPRPALRKHGLVEQEAACHYKN
jgi:hypothetical protein